MKDKNHKPRINTAHNYSMHGWICVVAIGIILAGCGGKQNKPPSPNIAATYDNGEITVDSLENYSERRIPGLKMLANDSLVAPEDRISEEKEIYRGLIREIVLDEMVKRKIKDMQLDNRANIRHALDHIEEELTLQQLHSEMHEKDRIPVDEVELQQYYDENRSRFGDRSLYEARDEIKKILASQKEGEYVVNYIAELKDGATITKNYGILRVPEPTIDEAREAYERDKETYSEPEKWVIEQIEVSDTTPKAKDEAQKAWIKLGAGEKFEVVAKLFGRNNSFTVVDYAAGMRGDAFDNAVTSLNPGEYSKPIQVDGRYYIVRLKEKVPSSYIPFEVVKVVLLRFLKDEQEKKLYEENKNKTLFTIHGRGFTLGDFYQEFKEMPLDEQEKRRSYDDRIELVDQMIERLLLLEDSYDRMLSAEDREEIEHVREDVLKKALHREEVDEKSGVSDEDVMLFYEQNRDQFKTPPRAQISLIAVRGGKDEASVKRAREKINEAYDKLKSGFFRKGMAFEEVAEQYSEDPRTVQNGGKLDSWISETGNPLFEMLNHSLHEKFMDLKKGEITEPFQEGDDYLIIKVREKEEPRQQSFEEVKDHLKEYLKLSKHEELTAKMYRDMIDQANLVIYDQTLESIINKKKEVSSSNES